MIFQPVNSKLDRRYPFFSCLTRPGMAGGTNFVGWVGDLECDCEHQQFSEDFFAVGGASVCVCILLHTDPTGSWRQLWASVCFGA